MTSPWRDLDRPPLRPAALRSALVVDDADVAAAARGGAPEGLVVVAELQTAGRGRADRSWQAPLRSGLAVSVLLRPPVARERWGWLPLLAGLAVAAPVSAMSGLELSLKWPNDVLVGDRKLAGILAEVVDDAVVIGLGLNVSLRQDELPVPTATSLAIEESSATDREPLLRAWLRELDRRYRAFVAAGGDADRAGLLAGYREACVTIGRRVRVTMPGARVLEGEAVDVDAEGRLVVRTDSGLSTVAAGDVVHVR